MNRDSPVLKSLHRAACNLDTTGRRRWPCSSDALWDVPQRHRNPAGTKKPHVRAHDNNCCGDKGVNLWHGQVVWSQWVSPSLWVTAPEPSPSQDSECCSSRWVQQSARRKWDLKINDSRRLQLPKHLRNIGNTWSAPVNQKPQTHECSHSYFISGKSSCFSQSGETTGKFYWCHWKICPRWENISISSYLRVNSHI